MSYTTQNPTVGSKAGSAQASQSKNNAPSSRTVFWLVLIAIVLMASNMRSPLVALGSIAPVVEQALKVSATHIGWLGAIPMLMFALGALVAPAIGKRFGLENTIIAAIFFLTLGIIIRSWWFGWTGFLTGTIILSLAIGFANTLVAPVIKQRTPNNIALMTGIFSLTMSIMSGFVSAAVYPLTELVGWQWALGSWSILGFAALIVWVLLRVKLGSSHYITLSTAEHDAPLNDQTSKTSYLDAHDNTDPITKSVWRLPLAWQLAIFMGLQSLLFYTVATFLPSIWISKGLTEVQGGNMGSVFQLMAPIAIIVMTWLIRRGVSIQAVAVTSTILNVIGIIGTAYLDPVWAFVWTAFMGLGCASIFTLIIMLFSLRTYTPNQASKLSGMAQTVAYLIAFVGPFGAGWLHEQTQSWDAPLLFLLVLTILNIIIAWLASRPIMIDGKPV